ncbi:MAG: murein hydrolase activator EnvC family protein [Methylohalobius sp. ZOD2]
MATPWRSKRFDLFAVTRFGAFSHLAGRLTLGLLTWLIVADARPESVQRIEAKIQALQEKVQRLDQNKQDLEQELARLERSLGQHAKKISQLEQEAQTLKQQRETLAQDLDRERLRLTRLRDKLVRQIRTAHVLGQQEPFKLLLNQEAPASFSRALVYYRYLNHARLDQIELARRHLAKIQHLSRELDQARKHLTTVLDQQRQKLAQVQTLHGERKQLLQRLKHQLHDRQSRLAKLEADKRRLSQVVASVQEINVDFPFSDTTDRPFHRQRGRLNWPVNGKLATAFGSHRGNGHWGGVVIGAPEGTPVRAVSSGRVVFADWLRGYGFLIIVQHERDFMTLYAFNQSLLKHPGERVETGEIIATVGRSGGRTQPGLYFAIRHRGEPLDPRRWCRGHQPG